MLFLDSVPSRRSLAFSIRIYTILFCAAFSAHMVVVAVTRTQFMSASNASWTLLT